MSSNASLLIEQHEIGPLNNFLYLIGDPQTREMAIVDPAWDPAFLLERATLLGFRLASVFLTHAHPDHVNGLAEVLKKHDVPVYISKHEAPFLTRGLGNLHPIDDQAIIKLGNIEFKCLHAPGHTPGCQCFLSQGKLFCGDVLFIDGCGRCDLPGGNATTMYHSLTNVIKKLPDATVIYPGHNYGPTPTDTIANQKRTNPYLTCDSLEEFLGERMG